MIVVRAVISDQASKELDTDRLSAWEDWIHFKLKGRIELSICGILRGSIGNVKELN